MNARALERLDEPAGESERDDVLVPGLAASSRDITDQAGFEQRRALEVRKQLGARGFLRDVRAAVHQAVANAMLQRYAPLPSGASRHGTRVGQDAIRRTGLDGERGIRGQPLAPVFVTRLERLLDQPTAKAGATEEPLALA